jgi:asparagine synthase (glutamine-hydrolysing)
MCGIVGARNDWLVARGLAPAVAMGEALEALAWRGPDGEGAALAGPWWLGCARLAITQAHSRQPIVRRGGRFVGVLNGAITNARELWARWLPRAERRPAPPNDAWLPLLAVARGDASRLRHLRGHHAYAVVDTHGGDLVLGQDRFGEKPLFAVVDRLHGAPTLVAFASTLAALRPFGIHASASPRRLAELMRFGWAKIGSERLNARLRIEPLPRRGEPLLVPARSGADERSTPIRTWWAPLPPADGERTTATTAPPTPTSPLRSELVASVARCVDTTVGVGLALSGGLDSSCLALALRDLGRSVPAYQLQARGARGDERTAATAVAMRAGLPLRPVDVGPELAHELPVLTALAGQPLGDPSVLALFAVARAAAADGVRVLLGGEGADELLLGYRRYRALARMPRLPWLRCALPRWSMRYAARWLRAAAAPAPELALLAVTPPAFADLVLAPELARRACWRDRHSNEPAQRRDERNLALAARAFDVDHYLRCDLLPKADVATMAAGVEARCPYLEGELARFGSDLQALGKAPLRAAFAADLPPEVLRLPKRGFSLPLDRWFRGELAWLDLLADRRTQERPHLRPGGVRRVVDVHRRGRADLGHGLYLLTAIELYLRCIEQGFPDVVRTEANPDA